MSDLTYGRDRLGDLAAANRLEWLVTNGIGGYASGTASGVLTRRYHGLLVASLKPPVGRTLLLAKLAESLELDGAWVELDANSWAGGSVSPAGHVHLESFRLEETVPVWTWAIGATRLEKRVWMEQGENTTFVEYRLASAVAPVRLRLRALVNHRDAHDTSRDGSWTASVEPGAGGVCIEAWDGATPLWLFAPGAEVRPMHEWYRRFHLAAEADRGLDCVEDHLCAAEILATLAPGETLMVTASTRKSAGRDAGTPLARAFALQRRRAHEKSLLDAWREAQPRASRGRARVGAAAGAGGRPVHGRARHPGRAAGTQRRRRLPVAQRLGPRRHGRAARAGHRHRAARAGAHRAVDLRALRGPGHAAQLLPRAGRAAVLQHRGRGALVLPGGARPTSRPRRTSASWPRSTRRSRTSAPGTSAARATASTWTRPTACWPRASRTCR